MRRDRVWQLVSIDPPDDEGGLEDIDDLDDDDEEDDDDEDEDELLGACRT